jgi:hypothetical protein
MITDIKVSFSRVANGEGTVSCFSTTRTVLERRSHAGWSIINNHQFHLLFSRLQEHFRHIDLNTMQPQSNRISLSEFLHMRMTLIICQTANPTASMVCFRIGLPRKPSEPSQTAIVYAGRFPPPQRLVSRAESYLSGKNSLLNPSL